MIYNFTEGKKVKVPAEVICIDKLLENGTTIKDCDMHVKVNIPSN